MRLDDYVSATIYSVMSALRETGAKLRADGLGEVWSGDIKTSGRDLVNVRLIKGDDPRDSKKSIPVILFDYDVSVTVDREHDTKSKLEASAGAKLLQVLSLGVNAELDQSQRYNAHEVQRLQFTIPVSLPIENE